MALCSRIFEYFDMPVEIKNPENPIVPEGAEGAVEFRHVGFSYEPERKILQDVNFTLRYAFLNPLPENLQNAQVILSLSNTLTLRDNTIRLNGAAVENATISGQAITIPVDPQSGTITFTAASTGSSGAVFAQMSYQIGNIRKADTIGTLVLTDANHAQGYSLVFLGTSDQELQVLFKNYYPDAKDLTIGIGLYDENGHLCGCCMNRTQAAGNGNTILSIPKNNAAVLLKVFTLSPSTLTPLRTAWACSLE